MIASQEHHSNIFLIGTVGECASDQVFKYLEESGLQRAHTNNVATLISDRSYGHKITPSGKATPLFVPPDSLGDLFTMQRILSEHREAHGILLVCPPETYIYNRMVSGVYPSTAVHEWKEAAELAIKIATVNRERLLLSLESQSGILLSQIVDYIKRETGVDVRLGKHVVDNVSSEVDWVLHVLARHASQKDNTVRELSEVLESLAAEPNNRHPDMESGSDNAYMQYTDGISKAQEVERAETGMLLQHLFYTQEQLDKERAEKDECKNQFDRLHEKINEKNQKIDRMMSSKSWKITSPLRAILKLYSRWARRHIGPE